MPDAPKRHRVERVAQQLAAATAEWEQLRSRHSESAALVAVLDLHQPESGYSEAGCGTCEQYDGMESTEAVPWPCGTFAAIRDPEPEPDGPPTTITINVHGTIDGRQLVDVMEQEILRRAKRNPVTYWTYKR